MNREEAQFILRAYRPNGEDAPDPQFNEALIFARQDPELARWFATEQALDAAFARKIRAALPVPVDLKKQLLLARATAARPPWWRRRPLLALAASVALLLVAGVALWPSRGGDPRLGEYRGAMVRAALTNRNHAEVEGLQGEELRQWLVAHRGETGYVLPQGLAGHNVAACKVTAWQGQRVTMLCFESDGTHLDLFVIDASALPDGASVTTTQFASLDGADTALWRRDGKIYLLVAKQSPSGLQRLI
jgi:anti-sigma factor RsiW